MMKIGLYFGSFNPIHIGHLIIANHMMSHSDLKQLWFVVSPHNPLKETSTLLNENHRYHMVQLAVEQDDRFRASNIEFGLPRPSYTIDTLTYLKDKYPTHQFVVIMGSDSINNIRKWKNYELLLRDYELLVYRRPGWEIDKTLKGRIEVVDAPMLEISSTHIRQLIAQKKSIRYLVPDAIAEYIVANGYYRKSFAKKIRKD